MALFSHGLLDMMSVFDFLKGWKATIVLAGTVDGVMQVVKSDLSELFKQESKGLESRINARNGKTGEACQAQSGCTMSVASDRLL